MESLKFQLLSVVCALLFVQTGNAQKSQTPLETLVASVSAELNGNPFRNSIAAVEITDLRSGKILFTKNAQLLLRPASNTKLFTSAAAVMSFGDSVAFVTRISRRGPSTLVCTAGGDPLFTEQDIQKLADFARIPGMNRVDTLILDPGAFDSTYFGEGWMWDDEGDPFLPALSAFCIEGNIFTVHIDQTAQPVGMLSVSSDPYIHDLGWSQELSNAAMQVVKQPRSNHIRIVGGLAKAGRKSVRLPMWRPQDIFADHLASALRERSIADSTLVVRFASVEDSTTELGMVARPLDEVLRAMNKDSDNLSAEMMLRLLGVRGSKREGSAKAGIEAMRAVFTERGLATGAISLVDGSGISFYNLVTANALSRVLRMMAAHPRFDTFRVSLAIAGVDGTLRGRMQGYKLAKYFQGKTGTVRGVSALSGYVQAPGGRLLAVVMLMQNFTGEAAPYRAAQDRIVKHCIEYSASPGAATKAR